MSNDQNTDTDDESRVKHNIVGGTDAVERLKAALGDGEGDADG